MRRNGSVFVGARSTGTRGSGPDCVAARSIGTRRSGPVSMGAPSIGIRGIGPVGALSSVKPIRWNGFGGVGVWYALGAPSGCCGAAPGCGPEFAREVISGRSIALPSSGHTITCVPQLYQPRQDTARFAARDEIEGRCREGKRIVYGSPVHGDRIADADGLVVPGGVIGSQVDAAVADIGIALRIHRPRCGVHENATPR